MRNTAPNVDDALAETNKLQDQAADPANSVWVSANAGTGKTHVLTNRVLRLLLAGTRPERILCLTFTKAAAAEMSTRIFDRLAEWVMMPDSELQEKLTKLTGAPSTSRQTDLARTLFTSAIETPGGFKVQTIHSFCERLLQRFPLEAGVSPDFRILDEGAADDLIRQSSDKVLLQAAESTDSALGQALQVATSFVSDYTFDDILKAALNKRDWLEHLALSSDSLEAALDQAQSALEQHVGLTPADTHDALTKRMANVLSDVDLKLACTALQAGTKSTDVPNAERLAPVVKLERDVEKAKRLAEFFLTKPGTRAKKLITKGAANAYPGVQEALEKAQDNFVALVQKRQIREVIQATRSLYAISGAIQQNYNIQKKRRAALDYDDLIRKSVDLLGRESNTQWVLFKLDEGLSHILVDESQDTSPLQWKLVNHLSDEFFSGIGTDDQTRTVFAVGDEKQSIYSFQGAVPEKFCEEGSKFSAKVTAANLQWRQIPLTLSFRTVEPILQAVDLVFQDPIQTPGVHAATSGRMLHTAKRAGQAGSVEIWPVEELQDTTQIDAWTPLAQSEAKAPVMRVAERIAKTVDHWLTSHETLESTGNTIQPGDIIVLVRKRNPFAPAIISALKARGIPVAGADRMDLAEQIAVQDLMSLADFLTLPEDDLALAEVLKSPIFAFDDEALFQISHNRKGTLWRALLDHAEEHPKWREAAQQLRRWRKQADFTPPYEFFAGLLEKDGVRKKLLSRLGPDAADPLDEFVHLALNYDEGDPPSLTGFLHWIRTGRREIKRDMDHAGNEVRVMTVHGAKGLEAPIVFLPDTCSPVAGGQSPQVLPVPLTLSSGPRQEAFLWPVKGSSAHPAIAAIKSDLKSRQIEESNRLLYVAMTRARDRLYIAGYTGKKGRGKDCWYDHIERALSPALEDTADFSGRPVLRIESQQLAEREDSKRAAAAPAEPVKRPDWADKAAPAEPQLEIPIAPSRLAPYEIDEEGDPLAEQPQATSHVSAAPMPSPLTLATDNRFLRGTVTHALLQYLPQFAPVDRAKLAKVFVDQRAAALAPRTRNAIVKETLAVLDDPEFSSLFGPQSRAEVPIVAQIPNPNPSKPALRLSGAIDRLADTGTEIFIVDYKTNRPPPHDVENVADAYLYQLASYRLAVAQIYPVRAIRCAILWTDGPRLMPIPSTIIETYEKTLWTLDVTSLDAAQSRS